MNKSRLEAFSDGVFAIVITLLALDIRIPKVDYSHLPDAILSILPKILSYAYSFLIIGVYWVSHHNISRLILSVDGVVLWANIALLLFVCFIPFPTSLMGDYPFKLIPVLLYGGTLLITNMIGYLMWAYVSYCHRLIDPETPRIVIRRINESFLVVNLMYVIAMVLMFWNIYASYTIFFAVLLYIIIFRRETNVHWKRGIDEQAK